PLIELQAAFNKEGATLGAVFGDCLSLTAPSLHIDKRSFVAHGARLILELAVHREAELANSRAFGRDAQFRIPGQVANEVNFIEICHAARDAKPNGLKLDRLDEDAVNVLIEAQTLAQLRRDVDRGAVGD